MTEGADLDEKREAVERALRDYVRARAARDNPEDGEPVVTVWAAVYEYDSVALTGESAARRGVCTPEQTVSASVGLGVYLGQAFAPHWGGE